jgi:uracil-DNA glycosylase family 4
MSSAHLLQWHIDMGADEAIGDVPVNRVNAPQPKFELPKSTIAEQASAIISRVTSPEPKQVVTVTIPTESLIEAQKLADSCTNLTELQEAVSKFTGLSIQKTASHCFFLQGNLSSKILILTDVPSSDDDRTGTLLSGDAGTLWKNILNHSKLSEDDFAISPAVFWRPPGNRRPTDQETNCCLPFVKKAIELMKPEHLIILGASCYNSLFNENTTVSKIKEQPLTYTTSNQGDSNLNIPTLIFESPSKLLKQPSGKAIFWRNMLKSEIF